MSKALLFSELSRIRSGDIHENYVYDVIETETDEEGNYIPIIIVEGKKGYHRTDWKWGKDKEIALKLCKERNRYLPSETIEAIKVFSMFG